MAEENEKIEASDGLEGDEGLPLCPRCLTAYDPMQHYCVKCGEGVGVFTPYIPFVNISYNYSIFGRMWQGLWFGKDVGIGTRLFYGFLIVWFVPIMLIGLPFVWLGRSREKRAGVDGGGSGS